MSDDDKDSKTEEPTQKKLDDARKKGQNISSKEINTLFLFIALSMVLLMLAPSLSRNLTASLTPFVTRPEDISSNLGNLHILLYHVVESAGLVMGVPLLLFMIAAVAAGGMQTKFNVSLESIAPKLEKISPMKGFGRMFSMKSVVEFIKGVLKLTIAGIVVTMAIWPGLTHLEMLTDEDTMDILALLMLLTKRMLISVIIMMFLFALIDYMYQRFTFMRNLRMSKQEIKDEYKQQEGDPHIKQRLRAIRMERTRKRMMAAVPDADVVITNPTHYAIALKYDSNTMEAPMVVAKGVDKVAFKIREIAEANKIMVMRNPPLARALYDNAEIDQTIPYEYFQAVAKIIGYVYKLKGRVLRPPTKKKA